IGQGAGDAPDGLAGIQPSRRNARDPERNHRAGARIAMSDERALLIDTADRLFATSPPWVTLEDSGVCSVLVPEELGGVGSCFGDAGALIERAGWHAIDLPVAETLLARGLIGRASGAIPDGALTIAVAGQGALECSADGTFAYSGRLLRVPWGSR